ncbi:hypothetical protein TPHA_0G02350 [Tetrapisispora phaffii CBS 4417]|uniref:Nuclear cap-binding protein complex subunit 1 n=1 Tax=Tetrapisispora phaffii (strain ATCC 24235 / CBS 4417 / NBRC 1672 / NRRL Y-8282 / UCD 70-5) TaxID=1071381 RepID=G8BVZ2_TETPH|nr:hypothetical protein TPHA_0G02350 [Tetrapisispora phaffii CBS 4417]CCE64070.1 hypothetical protein TPHA_0G02350 [Tetrapisispora phaffii CBS 4417]
MSGRKRSADFDDDGYRDFRPRMPKRQRVPPVVQLCKEMMPDICTIGESVKAFEEDIKFLSEAIISEFGHEEYFNNALLSTFKAVIFEQPHKQPSIALLTMVVNTQNQEAGKSIVNFFVAELQQLINESTNEDFKVASNETGPWNRSKLIIRFLSLLSPMISLDDLMNLYRSFFNLAIELNNIEVDKRNPLSEAIYSNTLINIPYLFFFNRANEVLKSKVEELLIYVETSYQLRVNDIQLLDEYNGQNPIPRVELIQVILSNVKKALANNAEQLTQLFPNWLHLLTAQPGDQGFNEALRLPDVEELKVFSSFDKDFGSIDNMWKTPRFNFHVYLPTSSSDFETIIPITTYAGFLFKDIILDIIQGMEFNRKAVAKQVIMLHQFFKEGIFAEAGISIAQLNQQFEQDPLISTFKLEDLVIETILSLIFKLPTVLQPYAYYYTLLVEICQNSPKAIAPVFGRAFRFFYTNIDNLDFELKQRYLDWFSIQMSNFSFSWKWNEWEEDSQKYGKTLYNPKMVFAKNLISKELRLTSNTLDVEESLTNEFKQYLDNAYVTRDELIGYYQSFFHSFTVNPEDVKKHDLYFIQENVPISATVRKLLDYMHKQGENKVVTELDEIIKEFKEDYGNIIVDFDRFIVALMIQCVAHSGSRSLSHANKYISDLTEDIKHAFSSLEIDEAKKEYTIVEAMLRFWNSNSQTGFLNTDALRYAGFITTKSLFSFCFEESNGRNLGLTDATAVESVLRNLSQDSALTSGNTENFENIFEKLCLILNDCVSKLGATVTEAIVLPMLDESATSFDPALLQQLDLIWKYQTALSFIKSILRKYSKEYKLLSEKSILG